MLQARLLQGFAEYLAPVLKQSQFAEKGVLTPEEFVAAGDNLVAKCPTWEWYALWGQHSHLRKYVLLFVVPVAAVGKQRLWR